MRRHESKFEGGVRRAPACMERMTRTTSPWIEPPARRIATRRLVLRAVEPADAAELHAVAERNRERLEPWMSVPALEEIEAALPRVAHGFATGGDLVYVITSRAGAIIGGAGA